MSLFKKIFWDNQLDIDHENDQLVPVFSKINQNLIKSQKYFEKLDSLKQRESILILKQNSSYLNRDIFFNDFENYVKLSKFEFNNDEIISNFYNHYQAQEFINVDSFVDELSEYVYNYELSGLTPSECLDLIFTIQRITRDKGRLKAYLYSNRLVRYLKNNTQLQLTNFYNLFRSTPIWFSCHMYLDLLSNIKKGINSKENDKITITDLFNSTKNEQELLLRTFTLLN
jgi:hypothetical protein